MTDFYIDEKTVKQIFDQFKTDHPLSTMNESDFEKIGYVVYSPANDTFLNVAHKWSESHEWAVCFDSIDEAVKIAKSIPKDANSQKLEVSVYVRSQFTSLFLSVWSNTNIQPKQEEES